MTEKKRSLLRLFGYFVGSLAALIVAAVVIVSFARIPINLGSYKWIIESSASSALGRVVAIDGDITVTTSLWPYFEIRDLRIQNPADFGDGDFARLDLARITVGLVPLLQKKIRVRELRVENLALDLVRDESGDVNWAFDVSAGEQVTQPADTEIVETAFEMGTDTLAVEQLALGGISVSFTDDGAGKSFVFELNEASGGAPAGEPMTLAMSGRILEEPYTVDIEASSLSEFLALSNSRLALQVELAETRFTFDGLANVMSGSRSVEFEVGMEGANLDSLGDFLRLDVPPLKDYALGASFRAEPGQLELQDVFATVGDSTINGNVVIDRTGSVPFASIELTSDMIQLSDFETGDWSPDRPEPVTGSEATPAEGENDAAEERRAKLLDPATLQRANLSLSASVAEVLSGDDELGSGEVKLTLKDGRLSLDPLRLSTPRTNLLLAASIKPGEEPSDAGLRVLIENFDLGKLARLANPESDAAGPLNMDIDVKMQANGIRDLLAGSSGYVDVAGNPQNVESGAVDLWAVNLVSSVVSSSVEDQSASEINCVISRWSIEEGVMTARQLAIDTSRIRICGEGSIDFNEKTFELEVFPTAKKPEFFSLASPLVIEGDFADFDIGAKGGIVAVGTTAFRFAVSPVTTPFKRLVREDLPQDGADICATPIGPHEGELEPLPGC